jgi:hypothetical protein
MGWGEIKEVENTPPNRPATEPEYVVEFVGEGFMNTPLFTVERNWVIAWLATEDSSPYLYIYDSTGELYDICGGTPLGESYYYGTGTYYISTLILGPWAIIVDYQ